MKTKSFKERLTYQIDNWMSRGTASKLVLLFATTGIIVTILGILVWLITKKNGATAGQSIWSVLMHALDPGVISGDQGSKLFLFLMLLATFAGVFYLALLIGFINDAIQSRMEELSMGREAVIEENHVVILGFNESTMIILDELIQANDNQAKRRNAVVIMDVMEKKDIEEKVKTRFPTTGNVQVICRSGSIYNRNDLMRCSIQTCSSIIIVEDDDFTVIKSILACTQILNEAEQKSKGYITAVINKRTNERAAKIAGYDVDANENRKEQKMDRLELLLLENTIARIMTHTCRQTGLSRAFLELFNYRDSEFYIVGSEQSPGLFHSMNGKTMREINRHLSDVIAVGIVDKNDKTVIGDPNIVKLEKGSRLIVLAEDDDTVEIHKKTRIHFEPSVESFKESPVKVLIIGASTKLPMVLEEMSHYLYKGSELLIVADEAAVYEMLPEDCIAAVREAGIVVSTQSENNAYDCDKLAALIDSYSPDFMLNLSDYSVDDDQADEKSLALLLYIQEYRRNHPEKTIGVTTEMRSMDNQYLIQNAVAGDFIISRNIAALMMAQIAGTRRLKDVFESILSSEGFEVYVKPAKYYFDVSKPIDFYSISEAVSEKGDIFIGYMSNEEGPDMVKINPKKQEKKHNVKIKLNDEDNLIVLSENHSIC